MYMHMMDNEDNSAHRFESKQLLSDEEIKNLGIPEHDVELFRRAHYQAQFGITTWYDQLKEYTFKTVEFPLSFDEGKCLASRRNPQALRELDRVSKKIDDIIASFGTNAVFVKLSTRSPKDVPVYDFDNTSLQNDILDDIRRHGLGMQNPNELTWAFVRATSRALKVTNGREAVELLSRSTRIKEDLSKVLQFGEKFFSATVIVREWLDEVVERPQFEFRGFVNQGKLNALSQYFCFAYDAELHKEKENVCARIQKFFDEKISSNISHTAYVIDFYLRSDMTPMVIELNPFHIGAGPCLFSWREDRSRFLSGPFQFRIVESIPEQPLDTLPLRWQRWLSQKLEPPRPAEQTDSCTIS